MEEEKFGLMIDMIRKEVEHLQIELDNLRKRIEVLEAKD